MAKKPPWAPQQRWHSFLALALTVALAAGTTLPSDKAALLSFKSSLQTDQASFM